MDEAARFFGTLKGILSPVGSPAEFPEGLRPAGVLVPLREENGEVRVVLARRTERVPHHKGQVCFPGGSRAAGDPDLLATALREAREELGIREEDLELLGAMEPVPTVTGFCIRPFVARLAGSAAFTLDDFEMEEVFEVPLAVFLDFGRYRCAETTFLGKEYRVWFLDHGPHVIWGATARILRELAEVAARSAGAVRYLTRAARRT